MNETRKIAYAFADQGRCVVLQKRKVVTDTNHIRGPIRIRAAGKQL